MKYVTSVTMHENGLTDKAKLHQRIYSTRNEHQWKDLGFGYYKKDRLEDKVCVIGKDAYNEVMADYISTTKPKKARKKLLKALESGDLSFDKLVALENFDITTATPMLPGGFDQFLPAKTELTAPVRVNEIVKVAPVEAVSASIQDGLVMSGDVQTMSSKAIAEMTDKGHKYVLRDIGTMFDNFSQRPDLVSLCREGYREIKYDSGINKGKIQEIHLNFKATRLLVSRYDLIYCADLFERLDELENEKKRGTLVSQTIINNDKAVFEQSLDNTAIFSLTKLVGLCEDRYDVLIETRKLTQAITGICVFPFPGGDREISPEHEENFIIKKGDIAVKWNRRKEVKEWLFNLIDSGKMDLNRFTVKLKQQEK